MQSREETKKLNAILNTISVEELNELARQGRNEEMKRYRARRALSAKLALERSGALQEDAHD